MPSINQSVSLVQSQITTIALLICNHLSACFSIASSLHLRRRRMINWRFPRFQAEWYHHVYEWKVSILIQPFLRQLRNAADRNECAKLRFTKRNGGDCIRKDKSFNSTQMLEIVDNVHNFFCFSHDRNRAAIWAECSCANNLPAKLWNWLFCGRALERAHTNGGTWQSWTVFRGVLLIQSFKARSIIRRVQI